METKNRWRKEHVQTHSIYKSITENKMGHSSDGQFLIAHYSNTFRGKAAE